MDDLIFQNNCNTLMDNIVFIHNTFGYDNLISILESGVLKLGSKVDKNQRKLSGGKPMDEIYMNLYFKNLKNLDSPCGLVFSSKLLKDYDITINAGWRGRTIIEIKKIDEVKEKEEKIISVKKFFENPKSILPENLVEILPKFMLHEVLFFDDIPIKDYLVGITDCGFTDEEKKNISKTLDKNKLCIDLFCEF
jgi:hypothetical protein